VRFPLFSCVPLRLLNDLSDPTQFFRRGPGLFGLITLTPHSSLRTKHPPPTFPLDPEPTSALDPETTLAVEKYTLSMFGKPESTVKAIVWITHSEEQGQRVGTRFITVAGGTAREDQPATVGLV